MKAMCILSIQEGDVIDLGLVGEISNFLYGARHVLQSLCQCFGPVTEFLPLLLLRLPGLREAYSQNP